jgi:hypothetical protein
MAYFTLYENKLSEYKSWLSNLDKHLERVENNILQKDNADQVLEKVVSVTVSSVFVIIGSGVVGLFGVATTGIFGGVLLFIIGWLLSSKVNKEVFGKEKNIEKINNEDSELLNEKQKVLANFKPIKTKLIIQKFRKEVAFTRYTELNGLLKDFCSLLQRYNTRNLAFKYRHRHSKAIQKNILLINQFERVYCQQSRLNQRKRK